MGNSKWTVWNNCPKSEYPSHSFKIIYVVNWLLDSQPFFIGLVFHPSDQFCSPPLDTLQQVHVFPVLDATTQTIPLPPDSPPIKSISLQFREKDVAWLSLSCRSICSVTFPGTEVRRTGQWFPGSSFLPFLKMDAVFPFFQSPGTSPGCHDF